MSSIKNPQRFAELEYTLQHYFDGKVSKVMSAVKDDLGSKQADELEAYRSSLAGIASMANFDKGGDSAVSVLKHTGQWNSKTVEDYVAMCQKKLQNDKGFQKDLITMAAEWRNAVVGQIGRARYDELSAKLGGDLAYAYVATRMDDLMMRKLVKENMPKSTADYIVRKAAQGSIWGLEQAMGKSTLQQEIEAKGEKAFNPDKGTKVTGKLSASVIDAATLGIGSWKSFATYVGGDVLINAATKGKPSSEQKEVAMEAAISKGVFGSDSNVFTGFRQQTKSLQGKDNQYLTTLNSKLNNKIIVPRKAFMDYNILSETQKQWFPNSITAEKDAADRTSDKYKNVPLGVAPGQEDAYLEQQAQIEAENKAEEARKAEESKAVEAQKQPTQAEEDKAGVAYAQTESSSNGTLSTQEDNAIQQNAKGETQSSSFTSSNGWDQLLQATGLNGFGDVMGNAGYVVSMLPDVLIGMFTGKTQSLNTKNTMMPLASILLGMFVKNPILKLALIGLGGANLLNKAGKESINWQQEKAQQGYGQAGNVTSAQPRFRQYADEELNPRITNPVLQGTTLIANIDRVPCNIQLTKNVVDAYEAGALPLNTLANAVLAKYDTSRMTAQQQYGQVEQLAQQQTETIHRSR